MTISAVAPNSSNQLQAYFHQRTVDLSQLQQALKSGDVSAAQQAYNAIVALGQQGPLPKGTPFYSANLEQDFEAVGQALQSGDMTAAVQAFNALIGRGGANLKTPSPTSTASSASAGPDAVVTLSGNQ